jgi:curved DNA-binding protein CbpA
MSEDTHYTVLGVSEAATQSEIKAAYRNLLKKIHPDTVSTLSPGLRRLADDATKDITEAYSVLSDASKRQQYDRELRLGEHRLQSVRPPVASERPQVWPQNSQTASNSWRRRHVHHYEDDIRYSRLQRWMWRHPDLARAGLLVVALGYLCVVMLIVILMLVFIFCGDSLPCPNF